MTPVGFAYHRELNPKLWEDGDLRPEIRKALLTIAKEFYAFVDVKMPILDITFTGSNAAFNYTEFSDIDVHIITRYAAVGDLADNLFRTKKSLWGQQHTIKVKGYTVECYVEDVNNPVTALGVYSLKKSLWIKKPSYNKPDVNDSVVQAKVDGLVAEIEEYLASDDIVSGEITELIERLRTMRKAGLSKGGEFSVENLAFKAIRNAGWIDKLLAARLHADDVKLSLEGLLDGDKAITEAVEIWNDKNVIGHYRNYRIVVNSADDPSYLSVWTEDNKKIGFLASYNTRRDKKYGVFRKVDTVELDKRHRGQGLGLAMFRFMLNALDPKFAGLAGYIPDQINQKQIPAIYKRLGAIDQQDDWMLIRRPASNDALTD